MLAGWAPGVRTIVKRVLFHSTTALTGWAEFCSSSVAAFASGATCKKARINANVAKILNICLYLGLLFVRTPVIRLAYLRLARRLDVENEVANCDDSVASLAPLSSKWWISDCIGMWVLFGFYLGARQIASRLSLPIRCIFIPKSLSVRREVL